MAWGPGQKPSFKRDKVSMEDVRKRLENSGAEFISFLEKLDPEKTAIFHEVENSSHSGREGFRVVHFIGAVEEKWHNAWGHTWYGLGAWMS